jgi:predicted GNAT superfamily acetyltransferase
MTSPRVSIRAVASYPDILQIVAIQAAIWGAGSPTMLAPNLIRAFIYTGGIVLAAYDGDQMIGFVASFQGSLGQKTVQWSHMTAVLPQYRRYGIGRDLKLAQREAALAQGIKLVAWTFDPLRRANAIFNVEVLGVEVSILHPELYGVVDDDLNRGLLSDRFEAHWHLSQPRTKRLASGKEGPFKGLSAPETYATKFINHEPHLSLPDELRASEYAIELPSDVETLRRESPDLAKQWYEAVRQATNPLFAAGYKIERVYAPDDSSTFAYLLRQPAPWFLYVLETRDGSLYTGITPDVEKRLATHNAGKGAGYTAKRLPVRLMAVWRCSGGKIEAMKLEYAFKRLRKAQKQTYLLAGQDFQQAKRIQ